MFYNEVVRMPEAVGRLNMYFLRLSKSKMLWTAFLQETYISFCAEQNYHLLSKN